MPDPIQLQTNEATAQLSLTAGNQYVWRVGYYDGSNVTYTDWSSEFTAVAPMNGTIQSGQDIDIGTGKILYSNVYQTLADLPDAASYHGMFAHVHDEGAAYYAHAGNWVRLADDADVPTSYVAGLNGLTGSITLAGGQNVQVSQLGNQLTISSTQALTTLNGESGALSLVGGNGIGVNTVDNVLTVFATDHTAVNNLTGNVGVVGGEGIHVTTDGQDVVIASEGVTWSTPPAAPSSAGDPGDVAYDNDFFYVRTSAEWRRTALSTWSPTITITTQPQDLTLADGGSGDFTIAATVSDGSNATYQWQNSDDSGATWDTLTGSTGTTYSLSGASAADNGTQYRAIVSAVGASDVTSSVATLTVAETFNVLAENGDRLMTEGGDSIDHDGIGSTLTITSQPQNTTAVGGEASFAVSATVSDGSVLTYQWEEERLVGDGATWTERTLPSAQWSSVTYGNGTFVAVASGIGSGSTIAATSTDGVTWTQRTLPVAADWTSVTYGNGTFVAVATGSIAATSTDGVTWTQRTLPTAASWISVTYGNGTFVAVASDSIGNIAATSADGITWTQRTLPASAASTLWISVTYGNGKFVAVSNSYGGSTSTIAATSTDGVTWTQRTLPASANWTSVAHGDGTFVAVSGSGGGSTIAATSTDGISWTQRTLPASALWVSVTYGDGTFVAVADYSNIAATSTDGVTWTQRTLPKPSYTSILYWKSVTHGNDTFVAVSTNTYAATSEPTLQFAALPGETASTLNLTGLTTADDGERYRVVVDSPSVEPVTSAPATLTVT